MAAADGVEPSLQRPPSPSDETQAPPSSGAADEGGVVGRTARNRHTKAGEGCGSEIECGSRVGGVDGEAQQPSSLEAMITLIIDQVVGRRRNI